MTQHLFEISHSYSAGSVAEACRGIVSVQVVAQGNRANAYRCGNSGLMAHGQRFDLRHFWTDHLVAAGEPAADAENLPAPIVAIHYRHHSLVDFVEPSSGEPCSGPKRMDERWEVENALLSEIFRQIVTE